MSELTFWQHAEELRKTLLRILGTIAIGFALSFLLYKPLLQILPQPQGLQVQEIKQKRLFNPHNSTTYTLSKNERFLEKTPQVTEVQPGVFHIPQGESLLITSSETSNLKIFGPLEGMVTTLKVVLWAAICLTSPIWLYLILTFIAPALKKETLRLLLPFWALACTLFFAGLLFAWGITIPWANHFLRAFNSEIGENVWGFSLYIDYTLTLLLATGLAFESATLLLFLVHFGTITSHQLKTKRRHSIVAIFILSAILTPPDVFTQFMLAIPLMGLYEAVICYALICERRRSRVNSFP